METSNITYQDEAGNIKVKVDPNKCIACGRCITACKHNARYFTDDTCRFFDDLSKGIPVSIITAPSIRTNIPEYKNLFSYLKKIGVKKIYDAALGADICIWAHIKHIKKNGAGHIITQPCPSVVSYCEMYRHDLLPRLSVIHSPIACVSIYMKEYQGISGRIAAITPCISKSKEFEDTELAQYNITFSSLLEYLKSNNISLPVEETQFDHEESGLGSLFPMPGGFKENIEYFFRKKIHIAKAEGAALYEKLDEYAETPQEYLPDIFDVLNCTEGCNIGSAYFNDRNIFEIDKNMDDKRKRTANPQKAAYYRKMYKLYDNTLDIKLFMRKYRPVFTSYPKITEDDILRSLELLGKNTFEKQNIDCGACGSRTCRHMARKIALNVNIPVNCIVKSMEDAKAAHEASLVAHERALKIIRSKEKNDLQLTKLKAVVKATRIGLWDVTIVNNDAQNAGNHFSWSDEFRYMLGYSNETDFPNTFDSWNDKLHPDDKGDAHIAIARHLADRTGKTPYDVEYRMLCKNGEYGYFRACGEAIRDRKGNALRVAGAVIDITESKKVLLNTEKQRMEAENANRAKSTFLSNMSHEIRTPLNAIIGMTTIGKLSQAVEKKDDAFNKIEGASRHLLGVINDILDMSKIEANKLELSPVGFEYRKTLQKVSDIINPRIVERHQKLVIKTGKEVPSVLIGDDQRLSQVITNLISNAVKFSPDNGVIRLDTQLISEKNGMCRLQISVLDTGIGIADDQKARLFESFEQADASISRNYGGSGLGLSISKRIVVLMDGDIWVESQPGKGSKFIFTVLLKRGSVKEKKLISKNLNDRNKIKFKGRTLLLVEDIEINREIVITLLEPAELNIVCAENGEAAVRLFKESPQKYDLIFMDIQMPVMDGYEATHAIREFEAAHQAAQFLANRHKVPIIAMTANVFREDVEKCLKAGMNGHIRKPIDYDEMINMLRRYFKGLHNN
jgi:PAS domain S-box-containing protein